MKRLPVFLILFVVTFLFSCKEENNTPDDISIPDGYIQSSVTETFNLTYGNDGNNDDEFSSGMVTDNSGNIYFSYNITDATANKDIVVVKLMSDGSMGWAQRYDNNGKNDWSPDSGENAETGGTAGAISIDSDGNIYVVGTTTDEQSSESSLVIKISATDGSILWQKMWKEEWPTVTPTSSQSNSGYAIDAEGDYVYFTGTTGTNKVIVNALNKTDGSIFYQYLLDIVPGTKDRGYSIKQSSTGALFIGGVTGSYAYIAKINGGNTTTPSLAWVKNAGLSYGARINSMVTDDSGVFLSCDIRGVQTYFQVMKINLDGAFEWSKIFPGYNEDINNTHVVKLDGDYLYVGGRISEDGLDKYNGDALIIKLSKDNGDYQWGKIFYTGNSGEEAVEHRIKGISVYNNEIIITGQAYGTNENTDHFYGTWIENSSLTTEEATLSIAEISGSTFNEATSGEVKPGTGTFSANTATLQKATDKKAGTPPDADVFIMKIKP